MNDPVLADTFRHYREQEAAEMRAEERERRIDERVADLWADAEIVSEAMQSLDCLEVRGRRKYEGSNGICRVSPPIKTGLPAVEALRGQDFAELGRLIHAEVTAAIRERAEDEIDEEMDR